jgi:beta-hydroxylase
MFDRTIAASSLVSNDSVLDVRDFAWTADLREHWRAIRDEALAAAALLPQATPLPGHCAEIRPGARPAPAASSHGQLVEKGLERCPATAALVANIPGVDSACFSILAPGAHVPPQRGATKGLITCHLGLIVPRDGDARMRLDDRVLRWAEGETLVFDDTCDHEIWNDTSGTRIVLRIQFRRALRNPGRWLADRFLARIRRARIGVAHAG